MKQFYSNYSTHSHETFALGILECGEIEVEFHKLPKQNVYPNQIIVFNPNQVHRTKKIAENSTGYYILHIHNPWCKNIQKKLFDADEVFIYVMPNIIVDEKTSDNLLKLCRDILSDKDNAQHEKTLEVLLSNIFEEYCKLEESNNKQEDNKVLVIIEQYIMANINNQISLEDISKEVGFSEAYITRIFKKKFGLSPHAFLVNQKINRAKNKLLNSPNEDISQLAVEIGFYDQSHFTNTFKRYFSLTPKQYQKGE
ncbi:MAG: helix-turn-helix transcriptional regulator [Campylobacteraceae bacterium]|nr:helix-turn-helix transcriptional regulator [Campylobacteraceae bacterium]